MKPHLIYRANKAYTLCQAVSILKKEKLSKTKLT